jgi:hypothetical protein
MRIIHAVVVIAAAALLVSLRALGHRGKSVPRAIP